MFTGLIKEIGKIEGQSQRGAVRRLSVRAAVTAGKTELGDSVCVDGACLTVAEKSGDVLHFDLMKETLDSTTLEYLKKNDSVNLEPPLELSKASLSGHFVSGHIDEVGRIKSAKRNGEGTATLAVEVSPEGASFLVLKGSVALDGISLTVNGIGKGFFTVDIIPHTLKNTTIGRKRTLDRVNIEFDIMGKYAAKKFSGAGKKGVDEDFLKEHGFI